GVVLLVGGQRVVQAGQRGPVEAGADLAGVAEQAVVVVVAEQQGAEPDAGALRVGVAADDELLAVQALELQPVAAAPGLVARVRALGQDPFPALLAGLVVVGLAIGVAML